MDFLGRGRTRAEFERFVAIHTDELVRTGYLMTSDLAETEDLVQECLLRVARRWPRVRAMDHPGAYARRILVNIALDDARRRSRRSQELQAAGDSAEPQHEQDVAHEPAALQASDELLDVLRALPDRQRATIVLRYFGDFSEAQVADALGCSLGTVKSTASRGLVRLREALEVLPVEHDAHAHADLPPTGTRSTSQ